MTATYIKHGTGRSHDPVSRAWDDGACGCGILGDQTDMSLAESAGQLGAVAVRAGSGSV